jgi:uncharacterized membrane protein (DUF4010 family)
LPRLLRDIPREVAEDLVAHTMVSSTSSLWDVLYRHDLRAEAEATARILPVLMLHGSADLTAPLAGAQELAAARSTWEMRVLGGVDHHPWLRAPHECLQHIEQWLSQTQRSSAPPSPAEHLESARATGRRREGAPMSGVSLSDLMGVGIALAAGLLIGLERGWHQRDLPDGHRVAGLRTFALIGLLGGLSGLLAQRWGAILLGVVLAVVALLVLAGYIVTARMHSVMGLTTAMAAITTFLVGVLAAGGSTLLAAAVAVVTVALLQLKRPMHSGIGKLTEGELTSGIQLLLISVVILPVLPDRGFGPFEALNPYKLWWAVVLLALLSFLGFVLMRWFGARRGLTLTALLGGLVSSTATTATLARWAKEAPQWRPLAAGGATLACAAMFGRMAVLVAVAAPALGTATVGTLGAMAVAGAAFGAYLTTREHARDLPDLSPQNPLKLTAAVQFALFLAVVLLAGRFLADRFGDAGLLVTAAISGLVDVDAITLSVGRMVGDGVVGASVAGQAVFLAAAVNQVTKLGLLWVLDGRSLALKVLPAYALMALVGVGAALALG